MKNNWYAQFGNADTDNTGIVYDIQPDIAEAFIAAIRNEVTVKPPRHAQTFEELSAVAAQAARAIQHFEAVRDLAVVAADKTSPHADRKALAISAAMPPSRLYRTLEKHGRPTDRKKIEEATASMNKLAEILGSKPARNNRQKEN